MEGFAFSSKFLWVTLLLWASSGKSTDAVSRAIASLSPSWRVLSGTNVTFSCEDPSNSSSNEIKWFHNGSSISFRTSSFSIIVSVGNSGEYRCQTSNSTRSDPIYLGVYIGKC
ncbi:low affinity immunoglobulin gamma Fc region receptor III-A-like [Macrotis lagotis]|uniref:low affinity immunoglobulin gamma Fc region receptor III-A-like n=1 Tax=Macrotis lagotis TaxID=92651 RepID=UPI003D699DA0